MNVERAKLRVLRKMQPEIRIASTVNRNVQQRHRRARGHVSVGVVQGPPIDAGRSKYWCRIVSALAQPGHERTNRANRQAGFEPRHATTIAEIAHLWEWCRSTQLLSGDKRLACKNMASGAAAGAATSGGAGMKRMTVVACGAVVFASVAIAAAVTRQALYESKPVTAKATIEAINK